MNIIKATWAIIILITKLTTLRSSVLADKPYVGRGEHRPR